MNILIVSQYFWPESFRINDLAIDLVKRNLNVFVLTGKPNYPKGKLYEGYSLFKFKKEYYKGIEINRVPIIPRGNGNQLRLSLNYLSFVISSTIYILLSRSKYDITLTFAVSPITQIFAALVQKQIFRSKTYIWIQDLWPESVLSAGNINSTVVMKILNEMVKYIYKRCDKILVASEAFIPALANKGANKLQLRYVPNWAEDLYATKNNIDRQKYLEFLPKGFKVMFAGNIGEAQDFNSIIKAAAMTKHISKIKWIIVGDGRKKKWVESELARFDLEETVLLTGRFPIEEMPNFFYHADIMLMTLKEDDIFSYTIPTKIQSYLAFGKPIVGMLNGIGAKIIRDADCGYVCNATDYSSLAKNVIKAYHSNGEVLMDKGENGKKYYNSHFSKKVVIDNMISIFKECGTAGFLD